MLRSLQLELQNAKTRVRELERQLLEAGIAPQPNGASPPVATNGDEQMQFDWLKAGKVIW